MTYKWKIIFSGIIIALICITVYLSLRMDSFEKQYAVHVKNKNSMLLRHYKKFFQDTKAISAESMSVFLQQANDKIPELALLAIADRKHSIKIASKNERFIPSGGIYDNIIQDFTEKAFNKSHHGKFLIRYYDVADEHKHDQLKYYIFNNTMGSNILLAVFPYNPGKVIITKTALEILLIFVIIFIICTVLFIIHQKKDIITDIRKKPVPQTKINIGKRKISDEDTSPAREQAAASSDSLGHYIYKLFREIDNTFNTNTVSLYISEGSEVMTKLYELKGSSFIKTESSRLDVIDLNNELGREIRKGTPLFLNKGCRAILPLVHNGSLMGAINILTDRGLTDSAIGSIQRSSTTVLKHVSDYLVLNNVMIDRATGLYSEAYFKMKFNEIASSAESKGEFSLLFISIARTTRNLTQSQKNEVIRMISPVLEEIVSHEHILCLYENFTALLLPGAGAQKARRISDKVFKTLQRVRIKITDDDYLDVVPFIGLASSEHCPSPHDVLESARENIDLALTRDDGNVQNSRVLL